MSRVYTDTIEPRKSTQDITLGTSGETISVAGDSINVNTVKDKGGNTLWTSDGSGNLSSVNADLKGNLVLLTTQTASSSASISFTTKIDSTYDVYIFKFVDINPATNNENFSFQVNAAGASGYNETMTTTLFRVYHQESDAASGLGYDTGRDQGQGTSFQQIMNNLLNDANSGSSGELHLFNPSTTTYVKNFYARTSNKHDSSGADAARGVFVGGYINTTLAIDDIQFKMSSGNFDGTIKMYGLL